MNVLGHYSLDRFIARGGMGAVWRGHHTQTGFPVAIKLVSSGGQDNARFATTFIREAQTLASFHHPHIVSILDYGEVSEAEAVGELKAGDPYLIMELASGGSLVEAARPSTWSALLKILLQVLDAMAYVHAHGFVHRDIKPSNVLLFGDGGVKLADFGIVHTLEHTNNITDARSGSAPFMAPEQALGQWRNFGPWTDLYAFGCLLCWLLTGHPPFEGESVAQLLEAHQAAPPPQLLCTRAPVPALQTLFERLLAKSPTARFRHAADVAHALKQLEVPDMGWSIASMDLAHAHTAAPLSRLAWNTTSPPETLPSAAVALPSTAQRHEPTLPKDPPQTVPALVGLGIFAHRRPPFIAREGERAKLWDRLVEATEEQTPRLVLLRGEAGIGKSRMASWLCEHASRQNIAETFKIQLSQSGDSADALRHVLLQTFNCHGLPAPQAAARIEWMLGAAKGKEVVATLFPEKTSLGGGLSEHHARYGRCFEHVAGDRLPLLWFDDIHWDRNALSFARWWLGRDMPAMLVMTARDDLIGSHPSMAADLSALQSVRGVSTLELGPLPPDAHQLLVDSLLPLTPKVRHRVIERTAGNPLFAVQLLTEWQALGTPLDAPQDVAQPLPDSIHALWLARLGRFFEAASRTLRLDRKDAEGLLETAACLGARLTTVEWRALCALLEFEHSTALLNLAVQCRLVGHEPDGFQFVHGMLREAIERHAREGHRWSSCHARCAALLEDDHGQDEGLRLSRRAMHLLESGQRRAALDVLLEAAETRIEEGRSEPVLRLLDTASELMDALGHPKTDRKWVALARMKSEALIFKEGHTAAALRAAEQSLAMARNNGDRTALAKAQLTCGSVYRLLGDYNKSTPLLQAAGAYLEAHGERGRAARALLEQSMIATRTGRLDAAIQFGDRAMGLAHKSEERTMIGRAFLQRAYLMGLNGDLEGAREALHEGTAIFDQLGMGMSLLSAKVTHGEIERKAGHLDKARTLYEDASRMARTLGSTEWIVPNLNLCLLAITAPEAIPANTGPMLEEIAVEAITHKRRNLLNATRHLQLALCARQGQWHHFDQHMASIVVLNGDRPTTDLDMRAALEIARSAALEDNQHTRAECIVGVLDPQKPAA